MEIKGSGTKIVWNVGYIEGFFVDVEGSVDNFSVIYLFFRNIHGLNQSFSLFLDRSCIIFRNISIFVVSGMLKTVFNGKNLVSVFPHDEPCNDGARARQRTVVITISRRWFSDTMHSMKSYVLWVYL